MALPTHVAENRRRFTPAPRPRIHSPSVSLHLRWQANSRQQPDKLWPATEEFVDAVATLAAAADTSVNQAIAELCEGEPLTDGTFMYQMVFKHV